MVTPPPRSMTSEVFFWNRVSLRVGDLWLAPMIGGVGMVGAIFAIGLMGWLGPVLRLPSTPLCCVQDDPSTPLLFAQGEPGGVGLWGGLRL